MSGLLGDYEESSLCVRLLPSNRVEMNLAIEFLMFQDRTLRGIDLQGSEVINFILWWVSSARWPALQVSFLGGRSALKACWHSPSSQQALFVRSSPRRICENYR